MPRVYWYGPKFGPNSTHDRVSHTYAVAGAVRLKAMQIAHMAAFLLDARAQHRTGDSQIHTRHYPVTDLDSYVYLYDPSDEGKFHPTNTGDGSHGAAAGIEKRHRVLQDAVDSV